MFLLGYAGMAEMGVLDANPKFCVGMPFPNIVKYAT